MYRLLAIAILSLLGSCATVNPDATASSTQGKSLGISTSVGNELRLVSVALLVFGNKYESQAVPNWNLDTLVLETVQNALRPGHFTSVSKSTFSLRDLNGAVPPPTSTDLLLLIVPASRGDSLTLSNQSIVGVGLFERQNAMHKVFGHAALEAILIDTKTKKVVARTSAMEHWPVRYGTQTEVWPMKEYGRSGAILVDLSKAQLSTTQLEALRPDMNAAVEAAVSKLLGNLGINRVAAGRQ